MILNEQICFREHTISSTLFSPTSCYLGGECWWKFFTNIRVFHQHKFFTSIFHQHKNSLEFLWVWMWTKTTYAWINHHMTDHMPHMICPSIWTRNRILTMYFETVSGHFEVINGVIFVSNPQVIEKVEQETLQLPYITDMPRNDFLSIIFSM